MKKSSIRNLALAAVVAASLGAAGVAGAQNRVTGGVALSPEQRQTVQKVNGEFFEATSDIRRGLMAKHDEIRVLMHSPNPDSAEIEALSQEAGALRGRLMAERANLNARLEREGIPASGYGYMRGGMGMGMMNDMPGQGCIMGQETGMRHGYGMGGHRHNRSGHRF